MEDYDKKLKENTDRNWVFIKKFDKWLENKGLSDKTISKHVSNIDLYVNIYLNYYDFIKLEDGVYKVYDYLHYWYIRKYLCPSRNSLKESAASIKKFYEFMSEFGYVSYDDYKAMCLEIRKNMNEFLNRVDAYYNGSFYDCYK